MAVEKKFPSSPIDILYKSDLLLQKLGGVLLHEQDRKKVEATREIGGYYCVNKIARKWRPLERWYMRNFDLLQWLMGNYLYFHFFPTFSFFISPL